MSPSPARTRRLGAAVALLALVLTLVGPAPTASALPGDFTVSGQAQNEGTGASPTIFKFTVAVEGPFAGTVAYTIDDGTAKAGEDYVDPGDGTLLFGPTKTSWEVEVAVIADAAPEPGETFTLTILPLIGSCSPCTAEALIVNEDGAAPVASVSAAPVTETTGAAGTAGFTVSLDKAPTAGTPVTVAYTTAAGTATSGQDFTATTGTVTFVAGDPLSKPVTVPVAGDALDEADETFSLAVTPSNADCTTCSAEATITDDDDPPAVSVGDLNQAEGTGGASSFAVPVTLSAPSGRTVTVAYATGDGTATAGSDYAAASGTLTFQPGDVAEDVVVSVVADNRREPDETFTVTLSGPANATVADGGATATIANDDAVPGLSVNDAGVGEAAAGTTDVVFTVTLNPASGETVTVDYATADGTATAGADYTAASGTLTFTPGQVTRTVSVPVLADALNEADETFTLTLATPSGATLADATGTGTITNDDPLPTLSVDDAATAEGATGATTAATHTITLSAASGRPVSVHWATGGGTATAGADYTAVGDTTVTFNPGETAKAVAVDVLGDDTDEPNETYQVNLSVPANATVADPTGVGTVTDDDAGPTFSVDDAFVTEIDLPGATLVFTVTKAGATASTITVPFTTVDQSALAGEDYTAASGTVVFGPADTTKQIAVAVGGDNVPEADETLLVQLGAPDTGTLTDGEGLGTIQNDDGAPPTVSIADQAVTEGTGGTTDLVLTVSLSAASAGDVLVDWSTVAGTATAGSDYTAASGQTLTIPAGDTSGTVTVAVNPDDVDEADETLTVVLSNPRNATIADGTATGTLTDDDNAPVVSVAAAGVVEGSGGSSVQLVFTVSLSNPSSSTVAVDFATSEGTAAAGADYTAAAGTLTFAPGATSATVAVAVTGDDVSEAAETVLLTLSSPVNGTVGGTNPAIGTVTDDDPLPVASVADVTVDEAAAGAAGTTTAVFTVALSAASQQAVSVEVDTAAGTAAAPGDFTAVADLVVSFAAGETIKTVTVVVKGDLVDEADETFTVGLTNPVNATVGDGTATGTVTDDDAAPTLAVDDVASAEGDSGTTPAQFTITKTGATERTVTVEVSTADGTATAPGDYTALSAQVVTLAPGEATKTVDVSVRGDAVDESNEAFTLTLADAVNATVADGTGTGTIADDDAAPTLAVNDVTVTEGNTGTVNATFTVTKTGATDKVVTVKVSTAEGTASAGSDYTSLTAHVVTLAAGEATKTFTVAVKGDTLDEPNEAFTVTLADPVNANVADGTGTGTITDDDVPTTTTTTPPPPAAQGYSLVGEDGSLYAFGSARNLGDMRGQRLNAPVIGAAYTPGGNGYWLVAADGGIFTFGDATFFGSMGATPINSPVIGMAATPTGRGYWLFAGDGGIFTFGDAVFYGSMGDQRLNAPVINMEPLASGKGYWLVAADGGIFSFGQAQFYGSMGDQRINQPVFDMTSTDTDQGYWLVARDGGIFSFGDAGPKFYGSAVNEAIRPTRVVGMDATPGSLGYWIADASGKVYPYGNAQWLGDRYFAANPAPMIGLASVPSK